MATRTIYQSRYLCLYTRQHFYLSYNQTGLTDDYVPVTLQVRGIWINLQADLESWKLWDRSRSDLNIKTVLC